MGVSDEPSLAAGAVFLFGVHDVRRKPSKCGVRRCKWDGDVCACVCCVCVVCVLCVVSICLHVGGGGPVMGANATTTKSVTGHGRWLRAKTVDGRSADCSMQRCLNCKTDWRV